MIQLQVLGRPKRFFYGWVVVAGSFVNQVINSGLGFLGMGTFFVPLEQEFGWSKTALSAARGIMQVENGLMGPVEGILIDKFGTRITMSIGTFIFGLGLVLLGSIQSLWSYYAVFFIISVGSSVGGFLVTTVAVNYWFRRKRTLAMSMVQSGVGFGGIAVIPLLVWAQGTFGWREAAVGAGLFTWGIGIPMALLMRHSPERYGVQPDGDPVPQPHSSQATDKLNPPQGGGLIDFTLGEAMRTPAYWLVGLGHGMSIMVISTVTMHQFVHMEQGVGLARGSAAVVVIVLSMMNIVGRITGGILGDRFDKRYLSVVGMLGAATGLVVLATAKSFEQAIAFGVIFGFFWGMRGPMVNSIRGEYFGRTSFGKIAGTSSLITMPASIFGPIFAGIMADLQGDYQMGFIVLALASGLGSVTFLLTRPPIPPGRLTK